MKTGFKKVTAIVTMSVMLIGVLGGCGQKSETKNENSATKNEDSVTKNENNVYLNNKYADKGMVNIDGSKYSYDKDNSVMEPSSGIGIDYKTDHLKSLAKNGVLNYVFLGPEGSVRGISFSFYTKGANDFIDLIGKTTNTEEADALYKKLDKFIMNFAQIIRVSNNSANDDAKKLEEMKESFKNVEKLGVINNDTYYFAYNTDYSKLDLDDNEKANIKKLIDEIKSFRDGICLFPVDKNQKSDENQKSDKNISGNINKFNAKTVDGSTITEESFKNYDLTMINIWATDCGACKAEMPDLAKLYESLPKNVNMTSICTDAKDESELAKKILDSNNAKFKAIIPDDKLNEFLKKNIKALPTTIFVDKSGNLIGGLMESAADKDTYMKEINKRLDMVGK